MSAAARDAASQHTIPKHTKLFRQPTSALVRRLARERLDAASSSRHCLGLSLWGLMAFRVRRACVQRPPTTLALSAKVARHQNRHKAFRLSGLVGGKTVLAGCCLIAAGVLCGWASCVAIMCAAVLVLGVPPPWTG